MADGMLEVDVEDGVAVLRLTHGKANTLDPAFAAALGDALGELAASDAVGAIVLTGSGRIFSAGVDLKRLLEGGPTYLDEFLPALHDILERLFFLPKPVVAAVNGHAIAGGCVLACACDHRLMGAGKIGVPELLVGVPFPAMALQIMAFPLTGAALQDVVYSGRTVAAQEAKHLGLIDVVVDGDALLADAIAAAHRLRSTPTRSFALTKMQVRRPVREYIDRHGAAIDEEVATEWRSDAAQSAIRRYVANTLGG